MCDVYLLYRSSAHENTRRDFRQGDMGTGRPREAALVTYLLHSQRFDIRLLGSDDLSIAEPFREH